jgi:hypothetical protein
MRNVILVAGALVAACSTVPTESNVHGTVPGRICNAAGTDSFVGQPGDSETGAAIMKATHSAVLRWAPPGYMLTMDFSASRVTVRLGPDYKVIAINCG